LPIDIINGLGYTLAKRWFVFWVSIPTVIGTETKFSANLGSAKVLNTLGVAMASL